MDHIFILLEASLLRGAAYQLWFLAEVSQFARFADQLSAFSKLHFSEYQCVDETLVCLEAFGLAAWADQLRCRSKPLIRRIAGSARKMSDYGSGSQI